MLHKSGKVTEPDVYQLDTLDGLFDLMRRNTSAAELTLRQRGILVTACTSAFGDSYCSLAWGTRLAEARILPIRLPAKAL